MFKTFYALLVAGLVAAAPLSLNQNIRANLNAERIVRVAYPTTADLQEKLRKHVGELDILGSTDQGLDIKLSVASKKDLESHGLNVTDTTEDWIQQLHSVVNNPSFHCGGEHCAKDPTFFENYQSLEAIYEFAQDRINEDTNNLAEMFTLGTSYEGTEIKGVKLSGAGGNQKPIGIYFCGEHAREWLPPMFCSWAIQELIGKYSSDADTKSMLDNFEIYIVPVLNVDGYTFSRNGNNMWRKSRKPNQGTSCMGTDLNRNYDDHHCGSGASSNPCSDTYCGTAPFDNMETKALKDWGEALVAAGREIVIETDVHAYGQMWMNPWGWTTSLPSDYTAMKACGDASRDAIKDAEGLTFATGSIANVIYIASGASCDWFYSKLGTVYAYAPEVRGNSFQPNPVNIMPSNRELLAGMKAQFGHVLEQRQGRKQQGTKKVEIATF
jgi:hypothetical protein